MHKICSAIEMGWIGEKKRYLDRKRKRNRRKKSM